MNKTTGKPKGTAFVEFQTVESAEMAVAASKAQRSGEGAGVSLNGKVLSIDAALVQDSARELARLQEGLEGRSKDKRNLYLVRGSPHVLTKVHVQRSLGEGAVQKAGPSVCTCKLQKAQPSSWRQECIDVCCSMLFSSSGQNPTSKLGVHAFMHPPVFLSSV
jgi:RNA recognition motif-containing protein